MRCLHARQSRMWVQGGLHHKCQCGLAAPGITADQVDTFSKRAIGRDRPYPPIKPGIVKTYLHGPHSSDNG